MSSLQLTCNRYDVHKISNYTLSIQLSLDGLSFAIRDYLSNCYIHFENFPDISLQKPSIKIKEAVRNYIHPGTAYKKTFLVIDQPRVTNIPPLYAGNQDLVSTFFELNHVKNNNEVLQCHKNNTGKNYATYPVPNDLFDFFTEQFPGIKIFHITDICLWNAKAFHTANNQHLSVSIFKKHLYLTANNGSELLLNNSYTYNFEEDIQYFILNTFTKLGFNQEKATVSINGQINRNSDLIKGLQRFIRNVWFEEWPPAFNFTDEFFKIPPYYFYSLLLAPLCE